ncbi:hypothetical protein NPX13_g8407 [Xylaria arbuscula]|uniref:5'-3' DNA helicase ZGRF1-like N-terminal domain-containing protein n=1 Tax=Xylaria arbuscula TaxID=114810 RepID=A0A9W8N8M9_9PEZI|nr:hypothetical protein NPX13_g8407 [Xylaria arbuscula]
MATAVQSMQSSALGTPAHSTATTAPVREHTCLFTHDLRRKQKRWNDGRLKYHTFNRRVMVYDERGNFIGDAHWREDYDLADGDELELERGGVLTQVGECVGSRDQDLSDLIDKRAQEKAQRQAAAAARRPTAAVPPLHSVKPNSLPQKHLHNIIGTPSGHHGRAVLPKESPYEERRQKLSSPHSEDTCPAKRQRREISPPSKSGYAQNLFGATLTLSGRPSSQSITPSRSVLRHAPLHAINTQVSMNSHARLHSSTRPESILYTPTDTLDESEKTPVTQKQRRRMILDRENEISGERPVINPQTRSEAPCGTREIAEHAERPDRRIRQSRKTPVVGEPSRLDKVRNEKRTNGDDRRIGHRQRDKSLIDLTEDRTGTPEQIQDQPRTELKIKPRKKRGLLMIAERDMMSDPSVKSKSTKIPTDQGSDKTEHANAPEDTPTKPTEETRESASRRKQKSKERRKPKESDAIDSRRSENEGPEELQCVSDINADSWPRAGLRTTTEETGDDGNDIYANISRRSSRLAQHTSNRDTISLSGADRDRGSSRSRSREDFVPLDEMPPPHLAKLGRRSIKSREIIGFIFDDDSDSMINTKHNELAHEEQSSDFAPNPDSDKQPLQSRSKVCEDATTNEKSLSFESQPSGDCSSVSGSGAAMQTDEVSSTVMTAEIIQPKPRITNPATRGKKAAKPSEAAGQMPQCPLSAELKESSLPRNPGSMKITETGERRPGHQMPGFSRANGGPWSREAYDLFEFKRPQ